MSNKNDSLGDRMKAYENVPSGSLISKLPVLIRVDGKAFHTFTRGMNKPFDLSMHECMVSTTTYLCKNIQGVQIAYTQSDEISLFLADYQTNETQGWFDYKLPKMLSIAGAMASVAFNDAYSNVFGVKSLALFDARVWNVPTFEVVNYFIWRQQDATRNSINCAGQAQFSSKHLHGKSQAQVQEMLFSEKNINWNDYPVIQKRGTCIRKTNGAWTTDLNIPVFTQDRNYIQDLVDRPASEERNHKHTMADSPHIWPVE
jgi:tRNA(His) guanylyltransferase